jgi:hypothetical protein
MARLVLCLDGHELAEYNMTKERYTIGRLPDNDIRLDHPGVSGHHALVINILDDSFLEDLNSTNGTTVNGRRVAKHPLRHEDVVRIGKHELRFVDEQQEDMDADEFERTMIINTMNDSPARVEALVKEAVSSGSDAPAAPTAAPVPPAPQPQHEAVAAVPSPARAAAQALAEELDDDPTARARTRMPEGGAYSPARAAAVAIAEPSVESPPPGVKPAPTLEDAPPPLPPAPQAPAAARAPAPEFSTGLPRGKIQVLSGTFAGKELELKKALTTLGRPGIQVAAISRRSEGFYIVHVESGRPDDYPRLNGTPIGPQAHELSDRDVIELAGVKMGFFRV